MKKLPKRPRTFGRTKAKSYHKKQHKPQTQRLGEEGIQFLDEISSGFAAWYKRNHDENGKYIGKRIPGLHG